jgi:hypothetical protein
MASVSDRPASCRSKLFLKLTGRPIADRGLPFANNHCASHDLAILPETISHIFLKEANMTNYTKYFFTPWLHSLKTVSFTHLADKCHV